MKMTAHKNPFATMVASPRRPGSEQRKPMQFPLIPPLPHSTKYDKENQRQPEGQNRSANTTLSSSAKKPTTLTPTTSLRKNKESSSAPALRPLGAHRETPHSLSVSVQPFVARRNSQGRRVLRYGETIDSLFLSQHSSPQHQRLCRDIAEGPLADDASSWLVAVQTATEAVAKSANASDKGADLIRLHRRATSRFSSLAQVNANNTTSTIHQDAIFELWLSYAQVQALYGSSAEDARLTFRHVQNQNLGVTKAQYYIKFAEFESQYDVSRAINILQAGLEQNAEPRQDLLNAVQEMKATSEKSKQNGRAQESLQSPKLSKKRKSETSTSPKRLKTNDGSAKQVLPESFPGNDALKHSSKSTTETSRPRSALNPVHKSTEKVSFAHGTARESISVSRNKGREQVVVSKTPTRSSELVSSTSRDTPRPPLGSVLKSSQKKPPLKKTPGLSRVGLSGKPMRVTTDDTPDSDSESSMDTATNTSDTIDAKALLENVADSMDVTAAKKPAPKLSKMDLSYMLNWDPNKRPSMSPKRERNIDTIKPVVKHEQNESNNKVPTPAAENVEEGRSNGSAASVVTSTLTSVHSNAAKTSHSHMSLHTHKSDGSDDANTAHLPTTVEPTASLDQKALLVAKSNPDFLPLVSEDNILRVNNVPYAKLGVIGKGGSCKVYRALAKDCSILAIKKVKLGGMDKKAINGYANEIALLKRLRGNPAIIQMYDSEVDLSRKAIYLCMELGEVDLSQVIQQQTMGTSTRDGKTSRSTLDMNFIRLTWQQMLKAVHSIHEERIIHGDLKPANFLFVRGALKLIDFGIAKAIQSDDTTNIYRDSQIGTLNYMSPEAILDTGSGTNGARMRIGRASDIWSLGCILYQMVYGRTPFADLHMIHKLQAIVSATHKITFPPDVEDEGAVDAMKLCLRRSADERPPIIGQNGLLNEHYFLNSRRRPSSA